MITGGIRVFRGLVFAATALLCTPHALAERAPQPLWVLSQCPFQLEVTVLSIEEKPLTSQITNIWHRVRIERVLVGDGLKAGDETAVVSQVSFNPAGSPPSPRSLSSRLMTSTAVK